jgi:hypothetical protein
MATNFNTNCREPTDKTSGSKAKPVNLLASGVLNLTISNRKERGYNIVRTGRFQNTQLFEEFTE